MPLSLPDDVGIIRQVYNDANTIACALQEHIDAIVGPDAVDRLNEIIGKEPFGPNGARLRIMPFLDVPRARDTDDACVAWSRKLMSRTIGSDGALSIGSWRNFLAGELREILILRDAALEKWNELTAPGPPTGSYGPARPRPTARPCEGDPDPVAAGFAHVERSAPAQTDTNDLVREAVANAPRASSKEIAEAIERIHGRKVSEQRVRTTSAWKEHRVSLNAAKPSGSPDAMNRRKPLTTPMLAVIDSQAAAPDDIVANQEEPDDPEAIDPAVARRRRFLEKAIPGDRRRLLSLPMQEQERELEAWDLTGQFMPGEPPLSGALKAKMRR